jgi:septum formation protein
VVAPDIDESPRSGETPAQLVERLAVAKASACAEAGVATLGADTVVALGRRVLPKALNEDEARACLTLLQGRTHRVFTAVAVAAGAGVRSRVVETRLLFKRLSAHEIDSYIGGGEWRGKAGGYAIQGHAARFVVRLIGSYSAVVGLPLYETANLLEAAGVQAGP